MRFFEKQLKKSRWDDACKSEGIRCYNSILIYRTVAIAVNWDISLAVEGLNREEIGIEEIFVPNEAESNGQ